MIRSTMLALACLLSTALPAQPRPEGPPPPFMLEELGLTEVQKQAIHGIFEKHRASGMERRKAAFEADRKLGEAAADLSTSTTRLRELHLEASEARFQALLDQRALMQEIDAVLTPEQQAKAKEQRRKPCPMTGRGPGVPPGP